ncbi:MAG TPA: DmsC/YnfH family molybdoenzyme membrane anchor subunit [Opitutus sp.]|nr:DmsC/YnfH family molybdoenzyme membrane anchor subunit [Opitutus sp.]
MVASKDNFPLLRELLAEQQRLATPAARFAAAHAGGDAPALDPVYRDLIPLTAPRTGEQYAFEVELDACTGCKACVSACHSLNGLDENETWRDVGLLVGGEERRPFQQTVTTACHHCADPACLNGCPVLAYEKDPLTGIVRHLDDQCIGCQYCILKCPYDVPKYNARLGIVRKCDLCHGRLADGEAPACVQACPTHAIRIVTVGCSATATPSAPVTDRAAVFLPAAPEPNYTQPTTRYVSRRGLPPGLRAADATALRVQPAHWPLVITLTLVPLAVGCLGLAVLAERAVPESVVRHVTLAGAIAAGAGLAASGAHLGKPLRAWRIFLGWRKSWLSREALLLGPWLPLATAAVAWPELRTAAVLVGAAGLFCSAMIYADTRRAFWRFTQAAPRILGSAVVLGAAVGVAFGIAPGVSAMVLGSGLAVKLACDARVMRSLDFADDDAPSSGLLASARLLRGPLRAVFGARILLALLTGLALPGVVERPGGGVSWCVLAGVLLGELAERYLFFRAVDAPKMPGVVG